VPPIPSCSNTQDPTDSKSSTVMDFKHSSLGSNELRLLSAVSGANDRDLCFMVSQFPRDKAPPYTAVSYTWGDDKPTEVISLNGRVFHIRLNLWSCLYYLSLYTRHTVWKHLWVDAICINQTNDSERNAQVRLMDKTYSNAACVSVWLGLVPVPEHCMTQYMTFGPERIKTLDIDGFDWADSIVNLANRPYWSRFWVIQEFLLGQNVELFCSGNLIDWQHFQELLCRETGIDQYSDVSYNAISNADASSKDALPLIMGRHPDRHPEFLQPLYELLVHHRRSRCKDPRDRVFALLGLITLDERALLDRFFPDYTLSKDHVVIITLAHLLQFSNKKIMPDSEELFLGLGIELKERRRQLLKRAADFDYCDDVSSRFSQMMAFQDELESAENVSLNTSDDFDMTETSRPSMERRVMVFLISAVLFGAACGIKYVMDADSRSAVKRR
jgi:hypothetical protein